MHKNKLYLCHLVILNQKNQNMKQLYRNKIIFTDMKDQNIKLIVPLGNCVWLIFQTTRKHV